jgi:hypothetical protein
MQNEIVTHNAPSIPWLLWGLLSAAVIGGTLLYGASLARALPGWNAGGSALRLTLAAGLSWCVFGPALVIVTRQPARVCIHVCLVTMACGEAVLAFGALANLLGAARLVAATWNLTVVSISNAVMAAALILQMRRRGVPAIRTLTLWLTALDGTGASLFWALRTLTGGLR